MPDITRNLFFWFRGPSAEEDVLSHRQLENNLTKSLIAILEHCDPDSILRPFLKKLGLQPRRDVAFSLQRRPPLASITPRRILLGITGGDPQLTAGPSRTDTGRPDAWVYSDRWTILVETKIGGKLSKAQLEAHARAAGWEPDSFRTISLPWSELYRLFKRRLATVPRNDALSRFLLVEWLRYLEYQNMAEFEQLEASDFDFFNLPSEERRVLLQQVRRRLHAFARHLASASSVKAMAALYRNRKVEQWKYSDPNTTGFTHWFNIGGDPSPREWHATIFFRPDCMSLEILNSRNHLARRLCRTGVDAFRDMMAMAAKARGTSVGIRRAWYRDPDSPYKGQHIEWADEPMMVQPSVLSRLARDSYSLMLKDAIQDMLADNRFRTELNVRRSFPRDDLLHKPVGKQVSLVAGGVRDMCPILKFLLGKA